MCCGVIEDAVILAWPVWPLKPGVPLECKVPLAGDAVDEQPVNPFAVLGTLKKTLGKV
mgnify:CR=1 FL=1